MTSLLAFLLAGVALLYLGAEAVVKGASRLALSLGLSALAVGLTIVSFSTSLPELIASLLAQLQGGHGDIALANVLGSNIANIGLILGLTAAIRPLALSPKVSSREMPLMLAASLLLLGAMLFAPIGRLTGLLFLSLILLYTLLQLKLGKKERSPPLKEGAPPPSWREWGFDLLLIASGIALLVSGGSLLVRGAVGLSELLGISERVIGLTVVALGTSAPELATSLVAAFRGQSEISMGNIVGSNIFNSLFIIGLVAVISPISFAGELLTVDGPVMIGFSLLLWASISRGKQLSKRSGCFLLLSYALYLLYLTAL